MRGRHLVAALVGAAVVLAVAGNLAWAAIPGGGGVYTACMLKNVGTVRLIDKSLPAGNLMSHCKPALEVEVSWNQAGQQGIPGTPGANGSDGDDGVSPSVAQVAAGDANCPAGGAAITDAAGATAYVCNGQTGDDGADGDPFSGTFTSPSGEYSISVTDAGIRLERVGGSVITLSGNDIVVRSDGSYSTVAATSMSLTGGSNIDVQSGGDYSLTASGNLSLTSGSNTTLTTGTNLVASISRDLIASIARDAIATVDDDFTFDVGSNMDVGSGGPATFQSSSGLSLSGSTVNVNGGTCQPAARRGDLVNLTTGAILNGSSTVCIG